MANQRRRGAHILFIAVVASLLPSVVGSLPKSNGQDLAQQPHLFRRDDDHDHHHHHERDDSLCRPSCNNGGVCQPPSPWADERKHVCMCTPPFVGDACERRIISPLMEPFLDDNGLVDGELKWQKSLMKSWDVQVQQPTAAPSSSGEEQDDGDDNEHDSHHSSSLFAFEATSFGAVFKAREVQGTLSFGSVRLDGFRHATLEARVECDRHMNTLAPYAAFKVSIDGQAWQPLNQVKVDGVTASLSFTVPKGAQTMQAAFTVDLQSKLGMTLTLTSFMVVAEPDASLTEQPLSETFDGQQGMGAFWGIRFLPDSLPWSIDVSDLTKNLAYAFGVVTNAASVVPFIPEDEALFLASALFGKAVLRTQPIDISRFSYTLWSLTLFALPSLDIDALVVVTLYVDNQPIPLASLTGADATMWDSFNFDKCASSCRRTDFNKCLCGGVFLQSPPVQGTMAHLDITIRIPDSFHSYVVVDNIEMTGVLAPGHETTQTAAAVTSTKTALLTPSETRSPSREGTPESVQTSTVTSTPRTNMAGTTTSSPFSEQPTPSDTVKPSTLDPTTSSPQTPADTQAITSTRAATDIASVSSSPTPPSFASQSSPSHGPDISSPATKREATSSAQDDSTPTGSPPSTTSSPNPSFALPMLFATVEYSWLMADSGQLLALFRDILARRLVAGGIQSEEIRDVAVTVSRGVGTYVSVSFASEPSYRAAIIMLYSGQITFIFQGIRVTATSSDTMSECMWAWSPWSSCTGTCTQATVVRHRTIFQEPSPTRSSPSIIPCPSARAERRPCQLDGCSTSRSTTSGSGALSTSQAGDHPTTETVGTVRQSTTPDAELDSEEQSDKAASSMAIGVSLTVVALVVAAVIGLIFYISHMRRNQQHVAVAALIGNGDANLPPPHGIGYRELALQANLYSIDEEAEYDVPVFQEPAKGFDESPTFLSSSALEGNCTSSEA